MYKVSNFQNLYFILLCLWSKQQSYLAPCSLNMHGVYMKYIQFYCDIVLELRDTGIKITHL